MSQVLWKALRLAPAAIGAIFVIANPALANEALDGSTNFSGSFDEFTQANPTDEEGDGAMGQVTSVSQLRDVQPTDWAFQALQNLVERYGCIAGYPDGTFRGNRAMTRYEFAAGLNACLEQVRALIDQGEIIDLSSLQRLQEEFAAELATLRGRVDALEVRTAELEANQFSTTTKLGGEVLFAVSDGFREPNFNGDGGEISSTPHFTNRVRLDFNTSFTGNDILRTRLEAANTPNLGNLPNSSSMARLSFDGDTESEFQLGELWYRFPIGEKLSVRLDAVRGEFNDNVNVLNPIASNATGTISRFGRFNPLYRQGAGGPGVTLEYAVTDAITLSAGYLAPDGEDPRQKRGLVNGAYAALGQIAFQPSNRLGIGLTYINSYQPGDSVNVTGGTGSSLAQQPFGDVATSADHFGAEVSLGIIPRVTISGWAGYTKAHAEIRGAGDNNDADLFNWAVNLAAELGPEGSLAGIVVGQPPKVTDSDFLDDDDVEGDGTSLHAEVFYRYQLNDNISITPGVLFIDNPDHNNNRTSIFVGTVRTTFRF